MDAPTPGLPRHRLSMTVLMTPDMSNFSGNVHGGQVLKLLDQVAFTCAGRYAEQYVVTLSVDRVVFREPIHVGELVTFDASVNYTGRTSMEVGIRVTTEDIRRGTVRHTNSCYFTMVALDDDQRPIRSAPSSRRPRTSSAAGPPPYAVASSCEQRGLSLPVDLRRRSSLSRPKRLRRLRLQLGDVAPRSTRAPA